MQYEKATFTTDTTKSDVFRVRELETVTATEDYVEKEFLLERVEKNNAGAPNCCGQGSEEIKP